VTSDGTAGAADYASVSGTLTFAAGQTTLSFGVPITDDGGEEPAETVNSTLIARGGGAVLGSHRSALISIVDDD
jgi:hypothetical protein